MNYKNSKTGFTLLEVSLYVVLFSIILTIFGSTAVLITQNDQDTIVYSDFTAECGETMQQLIKDIKSADNIDLAGSILNNNYSELKFIDQTANNIVINRNSQTNILEKTVNLNQISPYHTDNLVISSFLINQMNPDNPGKLLEIKLTCSNQNSDELSLTQNLFFDQWI